jgi:hypothetical protein
MRQSLPFAPRMLEEPKKRLRNAKLKANVAGENRIDMTNEMGSDQATGADAGKQPLLGAVWDKPFCNFRCAGKALFSTFFSGLIFLVRNSNAANDTNLPTALLNRLATS